MKYKIFFLTLIFLFAPACVAHFPALDLVVVEENPVACSSRSIRGHERSPCTTFTVIRHPGPPVRYQRHRSHRHCRRVATQHRHHRHHRRHR